MQFICPSTQPAQRRFAERHVKPSLKITWSLLCISCLRFVKPCGFELWPINLRIATMNRIATCHCELMYKIWTFFDFLFFSFCLCLRVHEWKASIDAVCSLTVNAGCFYSFKSLRQFLVRYVVSINLTQSFHSFYQQLYTRVVVLHNHTTCHFNHYTHYWLSHGEVAIP